MADITIPHEAVYEAWSEFRYPRPAVDEPSEAFMRAIRALDTQVPLIVAAELEQLRATATEHLTYEHDDIYEKRTETWEGDYVSAEVIDERIEQLRGGS